MSQTQSPLYPKPNPHFGERVITTCGKHNQHFLCVEKRQSPLWRKLNHHPEPTPITTLGMKEARTKVKARRLVVGFTQRDVATYANIKLAVYQHYESGDRVLANANYKTIKAIAAALVCPITDII